MLLEKYLQIAYLPTFNLPRGYSLYLVYKQDANYATYKYVILVYGEGAMVKYSEYSIVMIQYFYSSYGYFRIF